ncbi:MAG: hypothetical protein JWN67_1523 [Actinomycetia bacterium]|nr:hypothetical protein [Actinomycetes bacterium]
MTAGDDDVPARLERDGDRFEVRRGWRRVLGGTLTETDVAVVLAVDEGRADEVLEADALLDGLALLGPGAVVLDSHDPLLRHRARARGFGGSLRDPLRADAVIEAPPVAFRADDVVGTLEALLPGASITASEATSTSRQALRRATHGGATLKLRVTRGGGSWVVAIPAQDDLMPESVARSIDVALAVRDRFGDHMPTSSTLDFDRSQSGFATKQHAGVAVPNVSIAKINAAYVTVGDYTALHLSLISRGPQGSPARVPPPWTPVEGTVAHELWHLIDLGLQSSRYRDSIELRRRIGAYFGVETIEHLVRAAGGKAGPREREGLRRLVTEVSPYAATTPLEVTAELFKLWWCQGPEPSGAVRHFGAVVEDFFGLV